MEKNVPKSIFGVELSIAQYSIYSYNDTRFTMAGCNAGGLGFYMLIRENPLSRPAGRRKSAGVAFV